VRREDKTFVSVINGLVFSIGVLLLLYGFVSYYLMSCGDEFVRKRKVVYSKYVRYEMRYDIVQFIVAFFFSAFQFNEVPDCNENKILKYSVGILNLLTTFVDLFLLKGWNVATRFCLATLGWGLDDNVRS
jgi:hypothetical protein